VVPDSAETGVVTVNTTARGNLGFSSYPDAIYRNVTLSSPLPDDDAAALYDGGLQSVDDESWGIDNVR